MSSSSSKDVITKLEAMRKALEEVQSTVSPRAAPVAIGKRRLRACRRCPLPSFLCLTLAALLFLFMIARETAIHAAAGARVVSIADDAAHPDDVARHREAHSDG